MFNAITNYTIVWNLYCCELKIFVRYQNKEMASMAPSYDNYIDSYGQLLVNSGFIFTYTPDIGTRIEARNILFRSQM